MQTLWLNPLLRRHIKKKIQPRYLKGEKEEFLMFSASGHWDLGDVTSFCPINTEFDFFKVLNYKKIKQLLEI